MPTTSSPRARRSDAPARHPSTARVRVGAGLVVVMGLLTGPVATAAPTTHDAGPHGGATPSLTAARAIADGRPGTAVIGPDVVTKLGYTPVIELKLAARATGDCSSPVPLPAVFEPACRVHDLGYDLLRVAHRNGTPIPQGLRADLDSLLGLQMRNACEGRVRCTVMAQIAETAVHLNTVRQSHGAPVAEPLPW